jgi:hypothetical protein
VIGALGHRDIVLGAIRLVLEATTVNPAVQISATRLTRPKTPY